MVQGVSIGSGDQTLGQLGSACVRGAFGGNRLERGGIHRLARVVDSARFAPFTAASQGLAQRTERDPATTSLEAAADRGGRMVQHLGVWVMLGLLNAMGLYRLTENLRRDASAAPLT